MHDYQATAEPGVWNKTEWPKRICFLDSLGMNTTISSVPAYLKHVAVPGKVFHRKLPPISFVHNDHAHDRGGAGLIRIQQRADAASANAAATDTMIWYPTPKLRNASSRSPSSPGRIFDAPPRLPAATWRTNSAASSSRALVGSAITTEEMHETRIAPSAAKPITRPLKRMVPDIPDAIPARVGGMTEIPTSTTSLFNTPPPMPASIIPPKHVDIAEVRSRECHQEQTAAEDRQSSSQSRPPCKSIRSDHARNHDHWDRHRQHEQARGLRAVAETTLKIDRKIRQHRQMAGCEGQSSEICTDKGGVAEVRQIEHRQFLA